MFELTQKILATINFERKGLHGDKIRPAGPPGTDGRTNKSLEKLNCTSFFLIFDPPNPLDPFLKGLFNKEVLIISIGDSMIFGYVLGSV